MKKEIELLAPGGDIESIKAAIIAGADAIYCGLEKFNARNRASNISFEELKGVIRLAHKHECEVFLTLNILILEIEIPALIKLLNKLVNTKIDGIIIQDLGLFHLLGSYFPTLKIHASTQLTTHNEGQIKFLSRLGASRVNLSRELNLNEIKHLSSIANRLNVLTEVFIHGSQCISFSGICYMSSVQGGNSGNRGRCSQPCRDRYIITQAGKQYPLNLKDNSAFHQLKDLYNAGVYSFKIEGRIKKYDYIFTVVDTYHKEINHILTSNKTTGNDADLYKVFNRDFTNRYLTGEIHQDMFIDNPRDFSVKRIAQLHQHCSNDTAEAAEKNLYAEKENIKTHAEEEIKKLSIGKIPLGIYISGEKDCPLKITAKTNNTSFEVISDTLLKGSGTEALNQAIILKRLKAINETDYFIEHMHLDGIKGEVYLPFKDLTALKTKLLLQLNQSKKTIGPITLPAIKSHRTEKKPGLSVILSSLHDINLCQHSEAGIYFKLPGNLKNNFDILLTTFQSHKKLTPWFPAILIEDEYHMAVEFIEQLKPTTLVTDNTGIAYEASTRNIKWIAGPSLNIVNSYSLMALKEHFGCSGAFISNELNAMAIRKIKRPEDFNLYYSIYHPITLMTTRQCLFHQVTGCNKKAMDKTCIADCEKSTVIKTTQGTTLFIEKSKGNYHRIYHPENNLNTKITEEVPDVFNDFFIDLSDIATHTNLTVNKKKIIDHFIAFLNGDTEAKEKLNKWIYPCTNTQYTRDGSI